MGHLAGVGESVGRASMLLNQKSLLKTCMMALNRKVLVL